MSIVTWLLNPSGLTAHGFCLNWAPGLLALHIVSDALISTAYFSIPLALLFFARGRREIKHRGALYLFAAFIVACGATHLFSILTLWTPAYGVEGVVKLITAILSVATAVILWPLIPEFVALPSPGQLEDANQRLSSTVSELQRTADLLKRSDARSRAANLELERRVAEKTAELTAANAKLSASLVERNSIMQALISSEEEYRASFEHAAVGKAQIEPHSARILRANAAFAHMLGYTVEEMVGRSAMDFMWPEDREADDAEYRLILQDSIYAYVRERRYLNRDGTPHWGRLSATCIRSKETGAATVMVAVIEDIDERRKATAALETAKAELETALDQRTAALRQRDILLREVYHRVKNNLQIIDSFLVIQARQLTDADAKAALLNLRNRVYALGLVHHQLMDSSNLRTFDVAPFLTELSDNILKGGGAGLDRKINLSVRASPMDVGLDFAIPLGLLVTELVTNALKHAFPDSGGTIEVVLERDEDGGVALVVADDGRGFSNTPRSKGGKPGLGTSIIAGLVAQLRGTMTMQSDNGTRAEIRVSAPVLS